MPCATKGSLISLSVGLMNKEGRDLDDHYHICGSQAEAVIYIYIQERPVQSLYAVSFIHEYPAYRLGCPFQIRCIQDHPVNNIKQ